MIKRERLPRKMKKKLKKMMSFCDKCRMVSAMLRNLAVLFSATFNDNKTEEKAPDEIIKKFILAECQKSGISPADISKISYNDKLQTATITLNNSVQNLTMFIEIKE